MGTEGKLTNRVKKAGHPLVPYPPEVAQRCRELRAEGLSLREIGIQVSEELGCEVPSATIIAQWVGPTEDTINRRQAAAALAWDNFMERLVAVAEGREEIGHYQVAVDYGITADKLDAARRIRVEEAKDDRDAELGRKLRELIDELAARKEAARQRAPLRLSAGAYEPAEGNGAGEEAAKPPALL